MSDSERRAFIDRRCRHRNCEGKDAYRMIGSCYNCGTKPILGLFTAGHEASGISGDCPICGCTRLHWDRLATEDEIPAAFTSASPSSPVPCAAATEVTTPGRSSSPGRSSPCSASAAWSG